MLGLNILLLQSRVILIPHSPDSRLVLASSIPFNLRSMQQLIICKKEKKNLRVNTHMTFSSFTPQRSKLHVLLKIYFHVLMFQIRSLMSIP